MTIRQYFTIVSWVMGFVILVWGLNSLYKIFTEERDAASFELSGRKKALEQYATQSFKFYFQRKLREVELKIEKTRNDPLIIDDSLFLSENGRQVLPRQIVYRTESVEVMEFYDYIYHIDPLDLMSEQLSSWQERLTLLSNLKLAIDVEDAASIRWSFRDLREHRARIDVGPNRDIPYMLAVLDYFVENSNPNKSLIQGVLRGGTIVAQEKKSPGLQRLLLLNRHHFSKEDFLFLRDKIVALSRTIQIEHQDFIAASNLPQHDVKIAVAELSTPAFTENAHWYIEPRDKARLLGIAIDIAAAMNTIKQEMLLLGLLEPADSLTHPDIEPAVHLLASIPLTVASPRWQSTIQSIDDNYVLKSTLLLVCAVLVMTIMFLAAFIHYRKQKYLKLKSDFISAVSHELRTPLAAVRLLAETLERRLTKNQDVKDYPHRIISTIDGLSQLVDNILSFNRIIKGMWQPSRSSVLLAEVLSELLGEITSEFKTYSQIPLKIVTQGSVDVEIDVDMALLKILFRNLVSNACKYNTQNSIHIEIKVEIEDRPIIYFKDNGIGIAQKHWNKVFEEFYRDVSNKEKNIMGTGLGLALCKKIMLLHQGDIVITQSDHRGTVFKLAFGESREYKRRKVNVPG